MNDSVAPPRLPNLTARTLLTLGLLGMLGCAAVAVAGLALETRDPLVLGVVAAGTLVGFVAAPIVLDLTLCFVFSSSKLQLEELPPHLAAFVRETCEAHRMGIPKMRVIHDSTPTAFTYGWTPSTARVVYSQGLLELLTPLEVRAVIGHELGHAKSWDILVASIASAVPTFIRALGDRVSAATRKNDDNDDDHRSRRSAAGVLVAVRVLAVAAELVELSLSRTRELHADRFGATACGSAAAMGRALIKVSYGLATRPPREGGHVSAALQVQSAGTARATVLSINAGAEDTAAVQRAMAWDLWNPWARVCELQSTHPTTARRLLHLETLSAARAEAPAVRFALQPPASSLWPRFLVDAAFASAPLVALVAGGWGVEHWGRDALGWGLIAFGLALAAKAGFKYRGRDFAETTVAELLGRLEASPVRGVPCTLRGVVIGRGDAGLVWSEDLTLEDPTGIVLIDHRQPLNLWEFLWGLFSAHRTLGGSAVIEGWFRRGPVPYVEAKRMMIDGRVRRSHFRWLLYVAATVAVAAGALIALGPYEQVVAWVEALR